MLEQFFSVDQLARSWQQVQSGQNLNYKFYFKHIYRGYQLALGENLSDLSARLISGGFKARHVLRFYIPKGPYSQRPITQLPVEDQIAYQAIAARMADQIVERRRAYEYKIVFSNILSEDRSTFLFENWRYCYERFQDETEARVQKGERWVVTCDLASFYDTISHDILFDQVPSIKRHSEEREYLSQILAAWTFEKKKEARSHGIPQGPISSDLLAETFLLVLDEQLYTNGIGAIRYMDDIRIFKKTKEEAQRAALLLERMLRSLGLVPQSEKFSLTELTDGTELHKIEPSQAFDFVEDAEEANPKLSAKETERILKEAINPEESRQNPKSTLVRFSLFRGTPNRATITIAKRLAKTYPQHVEAAFVFLGRARHCADSFSIATELLQTSPFGFVTLKCWEQFYRIYDSISPQERRRLASVACELLKKQTTEEPTVLLGAAMYLLRHAVKSRTRHALFPFNLSNRMLLALSLKALHGQPRGIGKKELSRLQSLLPDVGLSILDNYHFFGSRLEDALVSGNHRGRAYTNSLKQLTRAETNGGFDPVSAGISELLGIHVTTDLRKILGRSWKQALNYVVRANVYEKRSPGTWLRSVNGLGEIFVRVLIRLHNTKVPKASRISIHQQDKKRITYGQLLDPGRPLAKKYPKLFDELAELNTRRNDDADSHALNVKTGRRSKAVIQRREVLKLKNKVGKGIKKILKTIEVLC